MNTIAAKVFFVGLASVIFNNANCVPLMETGLTNGVLPANVQQLLGTHVQTIPNNPLNILNSLDLLSAKPYNNDAMAPTPPQSGNLNAVLRSLISSVYGIPIERFIDAVEDKFKVHISEQDKANLVTVQDVINWLKKSYTNAK